MQQITDRHVFEHQTQLTILAKFGPSLAALITHRVTTANHGPAFKFRLVEENGCMASLAQKLSFAEFQQKYGRSERGYEYWNGEAMPKAMPTWIHGLLQGILLRLLWQAGYKSRSEVELRIDPKFRPKPDVIATSGEVEEPYPTKAMDVVIEILSSDDPMGYVLEKCQTYQSWGFKYVYVVNPESRQLFRWMGTALEISSTLTSIPAQSDLPQKSVQDMIRKSCL